jgi:hypothetical protein
MESSIDFSFIKDESSRFYIENAYNAVSSVDGGWEFMKTFTPEDKKGFMFSTHPMLTKIGEKLDDGHSGSSYGWTMRNIEYIAKHGIDAFKAKYDK